MNITTDIFNGDLQEEVYMKQPKGFIRDHLCVNSERVCMASNSRPDAGIKDQLKLIGFQQSNHYDRLRWPVHHYGCIILCGRYFVGREV